jgi:peroxiredoxin
MNKRHYVFTIVLLMLSAHAQAGQTLAPDFTLPSLTGNNYRLAEQRGKVLVLHVWSSWCGRCVQGLNEIQRLADTHNTPDLLWWNIAADNTPGTIQRVVTPSGKITQLYSGAGNFGQHYAVDDLPVTMLIDRDGNIAQRFTGDDALDTQLLTDALNKVSAL